MLCEWEKSLSTTSLIGFILLQRIATFLAPLSSPTPCGSSLVAKYGRIWSDFVMFPACSGRQVRQLDGEDLSSIDAGTRQHDLQRRDAVSLYVEAQDNDAFKPHDHRLLVGGN